MPKKMSAAAAPTKRRRLPGSEPPVLPEVRKLARSDPEQRIEVLVMLRYRPSSPPLPSLATLGRKASERPKHLTAEEFEARHGADPEDVRKVEGFARRHGLDVVEASLRKRSVVLEGSVRALETAFGVELVDFEHPVAPYRGHRGPVHVPEELAPLVIGVFGLDNRPVARPHLRSPTRKSRSRPTIPPGAKYPPEVAELYGFPSGVTGKGQAVGIIELGGGYDPEVIRHYFAKSVRRPMPRIVDVPVAGGANRPGKSAELDSEVALDVEVLGSIAYGADLYVFFAPPAADGFLRVVQEAVHGAHDVSVLSISWGEPEETQTPSARLAMNQVLHEAAVRGITVCVSTGDSGSGDQSPGIAPDGYAHVSFPATSPYALACGGTTLVSDGATITSEVVWNNSVLGGGATGGGVSAFFPCPDYQRDSRTCVHSVNPGMGPGRGIPDVAGSADPYTGYVIQVGKTLQVNAGTSAVAPLWAALIALINEKTAERRGFVNPALYRMQGSSQAFRDVTEGDNATALLVGGYAAGRGWDACTGWGSPRGDGLARLLPADTAPPAEPGPAERRPAPAPSPWGPQPGGYPENPWAWYSWAWYSAWYADWLRRWGSYR